MVDPLIRPLQLRHPPHPRIHPPLLILLRRFPPPLIRLPIPRNLPQPLPTPLPQLHLLLFLELHLGIEIPRPAPEPRPIRTKSTILVVRRPIEPRLPLI